MRKVLLIFTTFLFVTSGYANSVKVCVGESIDNDTIRSRIEGYLFLPWDFTDENAPQIHVRTWQPSKIGGKPLPKDEVFSLSDFDI